MFGGASSTPFGSPSGGLGGFGQPSTSTTPLFGGGGGSSTFGTPAASGSSSLFGQSPAGTYTVRCGCFIHFVHVFEGTWSLVTYTATRSQFLSPSPRRCVAH